MKSFIIGYVFMGVFRRVFKWTYQMIRKFINQSVRMMGRSAKFFGRALARLRQ